MAGVWHLCRNPLTRCPFGWPHEVNVCRGYVRRVVQHGVAFVSHHDWYWRPWPTTRSNGGPRERARRHRLGSYHFRSLSPGGGERGNTPVRGNRSATRLRLRTLSSRSRSPRTTDATVPRGPRVSATAFRPHGTISLLPATLCFGAEPARRLSSGRSELPAVCRRRNRIPAARPSDRLLGLSGSQGDRSRRAPPAYTTSPSAGSRKRRPPGTLAHRAALPARGCVLPFGPRSAAGIVAGREGRPSRSRAEES